jgi:uncharacterized protein DUF5615
MSLPMQGSTGLSSGASPRFLADENLERAIVEGLRHSRPDVVFMTAVEAGTMHLDDPDVLERAKLLDLILVSHDSRTMYDHFAAFLMKLPSEEHCPGVLLVSQEKYGIGQMIAFLLDVYDLSSHEEWRDRIARLPV